MELKRIAPAPLDFGAFRFGACHFVASTVHRSIFKFNAQTSRLRNHRKQLTDVQDRRGRPPVDYCRHLAMRLRQKDARMLIQDPRSRRPQGAFIPPPQRVLLVDVSRTGGTSTELKGRPRKPLHQLPCSRYGKNHCAGFGGCLYSCSAFDQRSSRSPSTACR